MSLFEWLWFGVIAGYVGLSVYRLWWLLRVTSPRQPAPPVVFRGSDQQAEHMAAWLAIERGRPVVAVHAGDNVWEFENFVARVDQRT